MRAFHGKLKVMPNRFSTQRSQGIISSAAPRSKRAIKSRIKGSDHVPPRTLALVAIYMSQCSAGDLKRIGINLSPALSPPPPLPSAAGRVKNAIRSRKSLSLSAPCLTINGCCKPTFLWPIFARESMEEERSLVEKAKLLALRPILSPQRSFPKEKLHHPKKSDF
ncbi:hypothetical protein IE53DRAFT_163043 [Violaceomyces palustris]|uniref:Uncharacterized protein n=1 Tax=Violaceomyces palustris TaxID=1673888 RepID=A0ACD0NTK3_9BASI|nr:hypothetical protein IE53DRAFT_163043 [Violaceomyces palustris]